MTDQSFSQFWPGFRRRIPFLAAVTIFLVSVATVWIWKELPIYPDEIAFLTWVSRLPFEGLLRVTPMLFCGPDQAAVIPGLLVLPAAFLSSFALIERYETLRYVGLTLGIFLPIIFFIYQYKQTKNPICLAVCFFFLAGVRPSIVSVVRPESLIILDIILCSLACIGSVKTFDSWKRYLLAFAIFALTISAFYAHPKSYYFAPVFLFSIFVLLENKIAAYAVNFFVLLIGFFSYKLNAEQMLNCANSETFANLARSFNLNPLNFFSAPSPFLKEVAENIVFRDYVFIIKKMLFVKDYDIGYLPPLNESPHAFSANLMIVFSGISFFAYLCNYLFCRKDVGFFAQNRDTLLFIIILSFCALAHFSTNKTNNFYEFGFWSAIILIIICLLPRVSLMSQYSIYFILVVSALAWVLSINIVSSHLRANFYLEGWHGPNTSTISWRQKRNAYLELRDTCDLSNQHGSIVHDDSTYMFIRKTPKPVSITYSLYLGRPATMAWFRNSDFKTIFATCETVNDISGMLNQNEIKSIRKSGPLCCARIDSSN